MGFFGWLRTVFAAIMPTRFKSATILGRIKKGADTLAGKVEGALEPGKIQKKKPWFRWFMYTLLAVGIFVLLWWLNSLLDLEKVLRSPWPALHRFWLPLLFFLGVATYLLGRWLWSLLGPGQDLAEFPDIDEAWEEAINTLRQTGIDPTQVPLFLVLGRPKGSTKQIFDAAGMVFPVRHIPRNPEAPLHVTATSEGIFLTCEGASLLGKQASLFYDDGSLAGKLKTMSDIDDRPVIELPSGSVDGLSPEAEGPALLMADEPMNQALRIRKHRTPLLKNAEEVQRLTARLQHLCRQIVSLRQPYCPINGILVLLPLASTEGTDEASQTGAVLRMDVATARETLQVHCPLYVMLCEVERVPGFPELVGHIQAGKQRQFLLGQPFPLRPDLNPAEVTSTIDRGVQWLFQTLFPANVYKLLKVEPAESNQRTAMVRTNSRLYQLLVEMRDRQKRVGHILTRGLPSMEEGPMLFGGCFLAATGPDADREQAFVNGVLRQLIENQNYVSWTKEALKEEAEYLRWTRLGYVAVFAIVATLLTMAYLYWPRW